MPQSGAEGSGAFGVAEAGGARGLPAHKVSVVERPQPVPFFDSKGVSAVAFAMQHAAAVDAAGMLYVWGAAHAAAAPVTPAEKQAAAEPAAVASAGGVTQVACSASAVYALTSGGEVVAVPAANGGTPTAQPVVWAAGGRKSGDKVVKISAGDASLAVLTASGSLYSLEEPGWAASGAAEPLIKGAPVGELARVSSGALEQALVADVACGSSHVLARTVDGRVVGFGGDKWQQLGQCMAGQMPMTNEFRSAPVELEWGPRPRGRATHIAAGGDTTFITVERMDPLEVEQIYVSGFGSYGTLGLGVRTHAQATLIKLPVLSDKRYFDEVLGKNLPVGTGRTLSAGAAHVACAMVPFPDMPADWYCWGANALAQRGAGKKRNDAVTPQVVGWGMTGKLPLLQPPAVAGWFGGSAPAAEGPPEARVVCDRENTAYFAKAA